MKLLYNYYRLFPSHLASWSALPAISPTNPRRLLCDSCQTVLVSIHVAMPTWFSVSHLPCAPLKLELEIAVCCVSPDTRTHNVLPPIPHCLCVSPHQLDNNLITSFSLMKHAWWEEASQGTFFVNNIKSFSVHMGSNFKLFPQCPNVQFESTLVMVWLTFQTESRWWNPLTWIHSCSVIQKTACIHFTNPLLIQYNYLFLWHHHLWHYLQGQQRHPTRIWVVSSWFGTQSSVECSLRGYNW